MQLVIRAQSIQDEALSPAIECAFDERGGTVGRSDANTLTLPDPERHVSRLQAEVVFRDQRFCIRNVGNANPLVLNGRPMNAGETAPLALGDTMVIGGYALVVTQLVDGHTAALQGDAADARTVIRASARDVRTAPPRAAQRPSLDARAARQAAAQAPPTKTTAPPAQALPDDPFADLLGDMGTTPTNHDNPFADLLQPATAKQALPAQPNKPSAGAPMQAPAFTPRAATLPDDFDPFADPSEGDTNPNAAFDLLAPSAMAPKGTPASADGTTDLLAGLGGSAKGSIDDLFGLSPSDPALGSAFDPFAAAAPASSRVAEPNHVSDLASAYRPPAVRQPPSPKPTPAPPPAQAKPRPAPTPAAAFPTASLANNENALTGNASNTALWAAFCDGAGISLPATQHLTPELMQLIGATLRHAVDGTVQLIGVRTTAKQALRAQVTTIQSKHNNPLKFAPDAATALKQLLGPPVRGFMAAPDAMQDAMVDLLGHAVGTMAGTQAALQGMLKRFEPQQLEQQLSDGSLLTRLVPTARQAKLWELYLQHHQRISESAREDFHEVFGQAFVKAYEAEADRVADHMTKHQAEPSRASNAPP